MFDPRTLRNKINIKQQGIKYSVFGFKYSVFRLTLINFEKKMVLSVSIIEIFKIQLLKNSNF